MDHDSVAEDGGADRAAVSPVTPPPPLTDAERACDIGDLLQLTVPFEGQVMGWDFGTISMHCSGI